MCYFFPVGESSSTFSELRQTAPRCNPAPGAKEEETLRISLMTYFWFCNWQINVWFVSFASDDSSQMDHVTRDCCRCTTKDELQCQGFVHVSETDGWLHWALLCSYVTMKENWAGHCWSWSGCVTYDRAGFFFSELCVWKMLVKKKKKLLCFIAFLKRLHKLYVALFWISKHPWH